MKTSQSEQVIFFVYNQELILNFLSTQGENGIQGWEFSLTLLDVHMFPLLIYLGIWNVPIMGSIPFQFHWPDVILKN